MLSMVSIPILKIPIKALTKLESKFPFTKLLKMINFITHLGLNKNVQYSVWLFQGSY